MPRITFAMKMESGVWKLNEILFSVRLPLADPDFLKSITDGIKSRAAARTQPNSKARTSTITFGADASVVAALRNDSDGGNNLHQHLSLGRLHLHTFRSGWFRQWRAE